MHSKYLIILLFGFYFLFSGLVVHAQESSGLRIQPAIIEDRVDPGQTFSSVLRATNLSQETKTYYLIKRNIVGLSPEGLPIFASGEEEETGFEITSWINISTEAITIPAGKTKEVPFSIKVPLNASPGGHFGGIFLSLRPERPEETGVGVGYQVGMIINLRISGEIFEEARIREFRTDKAIYGKPDVTFITRVENLGNTLLRTRGPIEITDFFDKKVATLNMNDEGAGVFPKQIRQFEISWQGEGLIFGRYQALMGLVYGQEGRKTISGNLSFWVLPLNIILPFAGVIIGLILTIFISVKLHIRRKLRQLRKATEGTQKHFGTVEGELPRRQKGIPFSRLTLISVVLLIFTILFMVVLLFFFA